MRDTLTWHPRSGGPECTILDKSCGEPVFVDFAGHVLEVIDGTTGEVRRAEVFVAMLGASNYTSAEATWTQSLPD